MALILNIDTAGDMASICLGEDGQSLGYSSNENQKDHASWLHVAIDDLLRKTGKKPADLQGVGVTIGPGSYTGLRVGLSTAKGFCYALNIPLMAVGTLEMMAFAALAEEGDLICPLIDARRMDVFTAVYDKQLRTVMEPSAITLDAHSFDEFLSNKNLIFLGNGNKKLKEIVFHPNAFYSATIATAAHLSLITNTYFNSGKFVDLVATEPLYIKEFFTQATRSASD